MDRLYTHIQGEDCLLFQSFRYITAYNTLCKTFYNCCLTYTRFTNQDRVVLRFMGKDSDHITDLGITSDNRIHLLFSCSFYQIGTIFVQCIIGIFRVIAGHSLITSDG